MKKYTLTIGWLYPDLMSTYGDRGNIICLTKRCDWRDIGTKILPITKATSEKELSSVDVLFGGGAQDKEQEIVMRDLKKKKNAMKDLIEKNIPALFVCGSPQLMGKFYEPAEGQRIEGVGVFDMISKHPGKNASRLIGNIVAEIKWENIIPNHKSRIPNTKLIVGFENHGGRTYLGQGVKPFAKVIKGFGNNGEDGTEGVVYKNAIGCYFHGPLLPKNPHVADWLIKTAIDTKYHEAVTLSELDDTLEYQAQHTIAKRLKVGV
jgi:CobQ-like glutamine amidotransferase family enzyme